jgi:hypothetical protein
MGNRPPSKAGYSGLSAELMELARQPNTKLFLTKTKSTDCCAYAHFHDDGRVDIHVDSFQTGALLAVVHELLHGLMDDMLSSMPKLIQEACVLAAERELVEYICKRPRMMEAWRKLVASKLEIP